MTREQIIQGLYRGDGRAIKEAIKALDQEPCEDCISREQAIKATYGFERYTGIDEAPYEYAESILRELPSVRPTRKKGEWVNKSHTSDCGIKFVASECTCCGKKTFFDCDQLVYNYCPNCGAKMEGEEESK